MRRMGRLLMWLGALMTAVGLIGGFGAMFTDHDEPAKVLLALVPLGFVTGFAGLVSVLLMPPAE